MNTLDDIRRAYPDAANASDLEILTELSRRSGKPIADVATDWGVDVGQNNGDFMRGLRRGGQQMLGSAAGAVGLAADLVGAGGLKQGALDYAREKFERDQLLSRPTDDVTNISSFGDVVDFAQAGLGQLVPMALGGGGAGIAGRVLGGAVARRGAAVLAGDAAKAAIARGASRGMTAAVGAQSIAQESGSIYADMVADGNDDSLRALGFGTVAGALDALPEVRALSRLMGGGERAAGGLLRRVATEGGKQAGMEAPTEVGQTGLELQANYKDLTDAEALRSYANAAALGALGGGAIGAVTGIPGQRRVEPVLDQRHDLFASTYGDAPRLNELPTGFGTLPPAESSRGLPTLNESLAPYEPPRPDVDTSVLGEPTLPSLYERVPEAAPPLQREGFPRLYGTPSERDPRSLLIPPAETLVVGPQGAAGVNVGVGTGDQSVFDSQPVGDTLPGALELAKRRALSGEITGGPNVAQPNGTGGGAGGAVAGGSGGAGGVGPVVAAPDNAGARAPAAGGTAVEPVADGAADGQPSLTVEVLREQYGVPKTKKTNKLREAELGRITALVNAGAIPADAVAERMTWLKAGRMEDVRQANDVDERNFVTGLEPEAQVAYMLGQLPTETQDILRQAAMGVSDQDIAKAFGQNDKQWTQKKREAAIVAIAEVAKRLGLNGDAVRAALSAKPRSTAPSDTTRAANLADLQEQYARGDLTDEQRAEIESQIRQMTQDRAGMTAQDAANLGIAQDVTEDGASTGFQVINAGADLGSLERAAQDPADLVEFDAGVNRDLTEREVDADSGAMRAAQATYEAWRGAGDPEWDAWGPQQKKRWMKLDQAAENLDIDQKAFDRAGVEMLDEAEQGIKFSRNEQAGGTTRAAIEAAVRKITGGAQTMKVMVVENTTDLPDEVRQSVTDAGAQAFVLGRRAYFVASRIQPGTEMAVFLHEVGVHLGMEGLIGQKNLNALGAQIQTWAESGADTKEARIARAAMDRVMSAEGQVDLEELVAYFVEEAVTAGVNPTADLAGPLGAWFRTFWAAVKSAMRKLSMMRVGELTPTDIVNLAYGAARLEIAGTWHGTAAQFRRFDHNYMGSGEGAQAFGWGTYLAQRKGIADGYWEADTRRKRDVRHDWTYDGEVLNPETTSLSEMAKLLTAFYGAGHIGNRSAQTAASTLAINPEDARIVADLAQTLDPGKAGRKASVIAPEGMVARVDINIADDELLDWDTPLSEQSEVVKKALEGAGLGADTFPPGYDGEQIYSYLTSEKGSDKAASEYLDSIGIKGIKFLDRPSRQLKDPAGLEKRLAAAESELARLEARGPTNQMWYQQVAELQDEIKAVRAQLGAAQQAVRTRNIVVFNDKNILRVNSWVANDKARIRFSKPAQATAVEATLKEVLAPAARRTVAGYARKVNYALLFGHQLVDRIGAALPSARAFFRTLQDRITLRDRREARVLDVAEQFYKLDKAEQARANRFIYESTTSQKWGYKPEWDASAAVDADMAAKFDALSPQAQAVVKQVFAYGNETQREYEEVLLRTKGAEIKAQLAEAEAAGDAERIAALRKEEDLLKRENGALKTLLSGPYAPLKRFGRHAVVVKSQAFMDAEAAGEGARIEEMQANPDHYQVMFVDSVFEREKKVIELQREFPDRSVVGFEREPESTRATELPLQAIKRLQQAIVNGPNGEKLSERSQRILARIASDLYVASLDSLSARHSQQRRRNIHGANEDMMRAFVSQGRGMAHMLATLEVNGPMQESLQKMRSEARTGRTAEKADALNEVLNRYTLLMETRPTPIQDGAMATTSLWMLLTNPAYWFGNATQPFMMSLPVLAGRHNAGASWSAVMQGYRDTMPALKGRALDPKKLKSVVGREADAVQELLDRGHIDLTLEREMGEISESSWHTGHKIMGMLRWIPQRVEVTNRVATALAAYRLEYVRATGQGIDAATAHSLATEYADQIILDTHGDYSSAGAPRVLMQGNTQLPIKLMGQFRKFQLVQLGLMAKLIRQSFSKDMTSDERTAARWSLAWMLGTYLTMTGLTGVIGSNVVWGIVSAFGDDDEKDLDLVLTRALGDRDAAILLTRGVPALLGMDVSQRLGMGNVLSLFPYADTEPAVKDSYTNYLMAATGPFLGGLLPRAASGIDYINQGDYWKGLELLVPNGITNGLRAARYATEGYTNRKGDLLMTPEEIGVVSEIFQAVGLPTTTLTDRTWKAGVLYELEQKMRADATRIKRQYTEAARSRDTETMAELRGEWKQLQEMRARNGMKPQPLSTLLKSPQQQREREEMADEGVAMTKATAGFTASVPD